MFQNFVPGRMANMNGNGNIFGATKSETDTGLTTVEISLVDTFEDQLTISQVSCEQKPEVESIEQTPEEAAMVSPPAGPPSFPSENQVPVNNAPNASATQAPETEPQWSVGSQCLAVWSEDGKVYPATVQSIEGERCRVQFDGYGNEEDMAVSTLKPPELQPKSKQGTTRRPVFGPGARRRKEVPDTAQKQDSERGDRGGRDRIWGDFQHNICSSKERGSGLSREDRESEKWRPAADRASSHDLPFSFLPLPPLPHVSMDVPAFVAPPPPFGAFKAKEPSGALDPTSHMLMLWYSCGFHTGSYMAQQQQSSKASHKD